MSEIAAPFAELYVFPEVVVRYDTVATAKNKIANEKLFISAIFAYTKVFTTLRS
jgi:hypothetical protein